MRAKAGWIVLALAGCMLLLCGCGKTVEHIEENAAVIQESAEPVQETEETAEEAAKPAGETIAEAEANAEPKADGEPKAEPAKTPVTEKAEQEEPAEPEKTAEEPAPAAAAPEETEPVNEKLVIEAPTPEQTENQRTVEITVPAKYADVRYRIGEITWNPDDSATYRLTEEEHIRLLEEVRSDIQQELNEMCASPYFLDFSSIEANEDCTVFTVVCLSIETTMAEQESVSRLYEYGRKFAAYEGKEPGNIRIDFMTKLGNTFVTRDSERDERQVIPG